MIIILFPSVRIINYHPILTPIIVLYYILDIYYFKIYNFIKPLMKGVIK